MAIPSIAIVGNTVWSTWLRHARVPRIESHGFSRRVGEMTGNRMGVRVQLLGYKYVMYTV